MALPAKKGDADAANLGPGGCWTYPPDVISAGVMETATVLVGGQPLVLHSPLMPPLSTGAWTSVCGPIPQPAPPQLRVIKTGINAKVKAEGRLVAVIGDTTNPDGFTPRFITGPGNISSRVQIC